MWMTVYPRVCGETMTATKPSTDHCGLSPRVRGNHPHMPVFVGKNRSIPACAGKPTYHDGKTISTGVYPRVCGETRQQGNVGHAGRGLSPRVRGNHGRPIPVPRRERSIPACAGKPIYNDNLSTDEEVYPRVCGETTGVQFQCPGESGLSPRVRGNRIPSRRAGGQGGSIPACAGKPSARS